ncbi:hypothetical protein VM1G_11967 [Cytospora mali]|uniref:Uncharacterized protein n=1 Tax=Cytospora mali TaxID=578113 RepID=A0A194WD86_CYTMA|nr:hypothetical protein VM1G_11967 [Valsa mali]
MWNQSTSKESLNHLDMVICEVPTMQGRVSTRSNFCIDHCSIADQQLDYLVSSKASGLLKGSETESTFAIDLNTLIKKACYF